jgi:hypothetical protein
MVNRLETSLKDNEETSLKDNEDASLKDNMNLSSIKKIIEETSKLSEELSVKVGYDLIEQLESEK